MSNWISVYERLPEFDTWIVLFPDFAGEPVVGELVPADDMLGEPMHFEDGDGRHVPARYWTTILKLPEE